MSSNPCNPDEVREWEKGSQEELLVGRDWTKDLDGAAIVGPMITPITPPGSTLSLEYIETTGNITKYFLRGGDSSGTVYIAVWTSEGELLDDRIPVRIRK